MRFVAPKSNTSIELAPIQKSEMDSFIKDGGMQSYEVTKFLGLTTAPVSEDEAEWFDKVRSDMGSVTWGIYVIDDDGSRTLIGSTSLHGLDNQGTRPYFTATSGYLVVKPEYWGKGIAGACHRARTMYAFDMLGLVMIRSAAITHNEGSWRALQSVGYVIMGSDRMHGYYQGSYQTRL